MDRRVASGVDVQLLAELSDKRGGDGAYHAWNAILHWMDAVVVFFLLRRILQWAKVEGARRDWFAAFGAGVFLLHPLQTESVAYVASRSEVLSVLLFNCALAVFVYRRSEAISVGAAVGVLILFAGATLSKEHTAILPAMLLLTDYFWNPGFGFSGIKKNWKLYAPILAGGAVGGAYVLRVIRDNPTAGFAIKEFTWYQYFFTQCRMIWRYLALFVLPVGQNLDPEVAVSRNVIDHGAILGLLALVAAAVAAWIYRKRYPLAAYGWFATLDSAGADVLVHPDSRCVRRAPDVSAVSGAAIHRDGVIAAVEGERRHRRDRPDMRASGRGSDDARAGGDLGQWGCAVARYGKGIAEEGAAEFPIGEGVLRCGAMRGSGRRNTPKRRNWRRRISRCWWIGDWRSTAPTA